MALYVVSTEIQIRVSSVISNSPIILNVDCDVYSNNSDSITDGLRRLLQQQLCGMDGVGGPAYIGTGCFHRREILNNTSTRSKSKPSL